MADACEDEFHWLGRGRKEATSDDGEAGERITSERLRYYATRAPSRRNSLDCTLHARGVQDRKAPGLGHPSGGPNLPCDESLSRLPAATSLRGRSGGVGAHQLALFEIFPGGEATVYIVDCCFTPRELPTVQKAPRSSIATLRVSVSLSLLLSHFLSSLELAVDRRLRPYSPPPSHPSEHSLLRHDVRAWGWSFDPSKRR